MRQISPPWYKPLDEQIPRIALLIETSKAFGRGLLQGVARYTRIYGPWSIWIDERSLDDVVPSWLLDWDGDGIIARTRNRDQMKGIASLGYPLVQVGEEFIEDYPMVQIDNGCCGRIAAEYFSEAGFKTFGFVGLEGVAWSVARRDAFARAVQKMGFTSEVLEIEPPFHGRENDNSRRKLKRWIKAIAKPASVMTCYDVMGRNLLNICRESNISVPDDLAVMGVDNDEVLCEVSDPPLSSINQGQERAGFEAAAMLDSLIKGRDAKTSVILEPIGVVERASTDTSALADREIATAVCFIRVNANKGIDVADVAKHVSLSRRTLERRFSQVMQRSVNQQIVRVQLQKAQ